MAEIPLADISSQRKESNRKKITANNKQPKTRRSPPTDWTTTKGGLPTTDATGRTIDRRPLLGYRQAHTGTIAPK